MKRLDLALLEDGTTTGLSVRNGGFLAEAASVCLYSHKHSLKVAFPVEGYLAEQYELSRIDVNELSLSSFFDLEEAVQFGAMGIAVAIITNQTGWKVKRSWKGTGFDYWVGYEGTHPFQDKLRLEVSGDLRGSDADLRSRLDKKLEQTKKSDNLNIPAYAIIVEFSNPKSLTGQR